MAERAAVMTGKELTLPVGKRAPREAWYSGVLPPDTGAHMPEPIREAVDTLRAARLLELDRAGAVSAARADLREADATRAARPIRDLARQGRSSPKSPVAAAERCGRSRLTDDAAYRARVRATMNLAAVVKEHRDAWLARQDEAIEAGIEKLFRLADELEAAFGQVKTSVRCDVLTPWSGHPRRLDWADHPAAYRIFRRLHQTAANDPETLPAAVRELAEGARPQPAKEPSASASQIADARALAPEMPTTIGDSLGA